MTGLAQLVALVVGPINQEADTRICPNGECVAKSRTESHCLHLVSSVRGHRRAQSYCQQESMEQLVQDDDLRESRTPSSSNQRASKEEETSVSDQTLSNLRELGDSTGAMDSILAELRTLTLSTPFEQTGMAALEKFWPHFTGVAPEVKLRDILPFRAKFCVKATALLLEWILRNVSGESPSSISDEALCVVARLIASPYVNFDHVELHDMLDANTEFIVRLAGVTRPSARLLGEITSAVRGSKDPSSLTKRRLLSKVSLQLLQRVAGSDSKVSTAALCSALLESGIGRGESGFEHFAENIVRGLAVEGSDANLSRALTWLDCVPEWLIALSVDRGIPVVIEWLLSAQSNGSGSACSSLLFHRCTLSMKAFLAIPTASQWMQKWLSRAISPDASDAGRAAALSLAVVTFRERASAEALEQFCKSLSAGGFLKLVQNTLLQLDFAPARKQPCPSVCIVASDDQSDEGEPSSLEDDEEAEDLPALRSPDPTSSFAVAVPSLELAALNPQARSQVGAQSSSLSRTREDLLDRFDRMLELVREHNVTESVSDARPSASSTSFADQFADLSSDEEASDNESEMVSETSGEQETVVRFRQRSEPKTLRAVSFQRYLGKPVHVADIPPSKLQWTITGSRPGMVLVGPSEECLREKAEQVELENFAEFHMGDLMWELVARSVGNCEASKARTLALLEKVGDQINELPSKRLHHMVYILAMDSWSAGYGESQRAVLKHFFKTEWTPPEVSWDWDLGHRTRLAHHHPYEIEAETSTGAALRAFVKRVSHRELSALTGNTESASLLKLGVSNGCESTSLPFCELPTSREAQLGWLARFVSDHAQLRREKKEREAQAHLAALQGLVAGQSTAPGIRLGALVIMHGLVTSVNAPLYSSLDVGLTDALVRLAQSGQEEEERSPIVLASVSLLERIAHCRRKNERILGDEQHLAMCSMSQMPSNLWFYGTCSALLWNTVQSPAQATAVSQSVCWGRFLDSMSRVPAWPRTRALEAAVLHDVGMESLVQHMDKNSASILAAIASTGSAKFAGLLAQDANAKAAELALLAWSPTFGTETRANLLSALSPQIDRVPGLGLNLVVAFTAAQRVNREFVRSHIAILVAALEQAIGDEECGLESPFYAAAAKALLPLAVSVLHSDSSLETVQALLGILAAHTKEKKYLRTLDLSRGGICGADLVCLESVVGTRGFEEIELSHNPSIGDDGATTVASWLAKPECNIRKLQMAGCGLGVRGFKRLADALRCPGHLTDLDLAGNAITEDGHDITGVLALAESLIWNTTLQQLDLSSIVLTQEGLTTLTRVLRYNGALSCLRLEDTGASPLQLGAVYEKLALNRSGATSSPHLGRGSLKKLPRLAREKARQTARILSGPNLAHLPYERSKGSGAKPRSNKGDVQTESLLEAFVRDTVRLENVNTRTEDSIEVTQEGKGESTATELYAIMQRIQDLKARQDALFVGTQTHK